MLATDTCPQESLWGFARWISAQALPLLPGPEGMDAAVCAHAEGPYLPDTPIMAPTLEREGLPGPVQKTRAVKPYRRPENSPSRRPSCTDSLGPGSGGLGAAVLKNFFTWSFFNT